MKRERHEKRTRQQAAAKGRFEEFLTRMAAEDFYLTLAEQRAARAMLSEGFGFIEVAAFLQASAWAGFSRRCLNDWALPECREVRESLRLSFENGHGAAEAAERAVEELRRSASSSVAEWTLDSPITSSDIELQIELFGRNHCRRRNWPDWMFRLLNND